MSKSAVVALLLFLMLAASCSRDARSVSTAASRAQSTEVRVVYPETVELESAIAITGSLRSAVQVDVKTEQPGKLLVAPPREGEPVTRGQVIARLDDTQYRLSEQQARATVSVAQASLDRARIGVQHADRELERARQVQASGGITIKDFQTAEWAARDARAQVQVAEAQWQQARETLALAQKRLHDCTIVSPISGHVQEHVHNAGIYLDTHQTLARLVDNSQLELEATVPARELSRLHPGQAVRFIVDSFPAQSFPGSLLNLAPAVLEQSRALKLRIRVPNPQGLLKAGMFVRGVVITGTRAGALVLPASAVLRNAADPARGAVLVAEKGMVRRREVELGIERDDKLEIVRGLGKAEAVLADPQAAPAEGERVQPASRPPAAPATGNTPAAGERVRG